MHLGLVIIKFNDAALNGRKRSGAGFPWNERKEVELVVALCLVLLLLLWSVDNVKRDMIGVFVCVCSQLGPISLTWHFDDGQLEIKRGVATVGSYTMLQY